jgi:hypothetical protein
VALTNTDTDRCHDHGCRYIFVRLRNAAQLANFGSNDVLSLHQLDLWRPSLRAVDLRPSSELRVFFPIPLMGAPGMLPAMPMRRDYTAMPLLRFVS